MKPSRYSFLFEIEEGKGLLFTAANGALAELDPESYRQVRKLLDGDSPGQSVSDPDLREGLTANGFVVEEEIDELAALEKRSRAERFGNKTLSLTIAPTLACNFACDYCFESQSPVRMSERTEAALMEFARSRLKPGGDLLITWFGGEPTLCLPQVERPQRQLTELAEQTGCEMKPASIITNGYLLDIHIARKLKEVGITTAQVTIDGPAEAHDARRKLKNGRGTYRKILENLAEIAGTLDMVVRINVDRNNIDSAIEVVRELNVRRLLPTVSVHFAPVNAAGAGCSSVRDRCFTDEEFSDRLVALYRRLISMGIYIVDYPQVFSGGHCGAVSEGFYVVGPDGRLFGCWEELSLNAENSIGDIFDSPPDKHQLEKREKYRGWDPFEMSECRGCDVLPICMGGCPVHGIKKGDESKGVCSPYRHRLKEMLTLRYLCDTREEVKQ